MNTILLTLLFAQTTIDLRLPPGLLESLCFVESSHNVNAVHKQDGDADSLGVCQIKYATSKDLGFKGTPSELMNPEINIYYAGKYLAKNIKRYHNIPKAVIAYNRGHAGDLVVTEYSNKVLSKWRQDGGRTAASYRN